MLAGYRAVLHDDEKQSVDTRSYSLYHSEMRLWHSAGCFGDSNRCLPIQYVTRNGLPFVPQNYDIIPTGTAIELQIIRANLQSVDGPPDPSNPTTGENRNLENTGDLYMFVHAPFIISESRKLSCATPNRTLYAGTSIYNPNTVEPDTDWKAKTFYLKACGLTSSTALGSPQFEIKPVRAYRIQGGYYRTDNTGDNVRSYQNMNARPPRANLSPRPDTTAILTPGRWYGPFTADRGVTVVVNPDDDTLLNERSALSLPRPRRKP